MKKVEETTENVGLEERISAKDGLKEVGKMFETNTGFAKDYELVKTVRLLDENRTQIKLYKRKTK